MRMPLLPVVLLAVVISFAAFGGEEMTKTPKPLTFDDKGAKVGEFLPAIGVQTLDDEAEVLEHFTSRPTVLATSSYTCPKSRKNYPALAELAKKYEKKFNFVVVYVIEAHPVGSASPYRDGKEDVTVENQQEGVLRKRPRTIEKRIELANMFKNSLNVKIPVVVDRMDDFAWKSLGAGPNMAVVLDMHGKVVARQGWFDAKGLDEVLANFKEPMDQQEEMTQAPVDKALFDQMLKDGIGEYEIDDPFFKGDVAATKERLTKYPALVSYLTKYSVRGNNGGETMLQVAARSNRAEIVKLLLERGADVGGRSGHQPTAVRLAARDERVGGCWIYCWRK